MRCALIDSLTRQVVNVIMADPARDRAPDGFSIVPVPNDVPVESGWLHSDSRGFLMGPEQRKRIANEERAIALDAAVIAMIEKNPDTFLDRFEAGHG